MTTNKVREKEVSFRTYLEASTVKLVLVTIQYNNNYSDIFPELVPETFIGIRPLHFFRLLPPYLILLK